jgi:hypothetical protein
MSTRRETLTDDGLGRVLGHWLAEGPTAPPESTAESAMRTVVTIPQRRWRGRILRTTGSFGLPAQVGLAVAGIGAAAVVAIGVSLNSSPPPGVVPSQSPGPTATDDGVSESRGLGLFTDSEAGFEVLIPRGWDEIQRLGSALPGVVNFGHEYDEMSLLTISAGRADGTFDLCDFQCAPANASTLGEIQETFPLSDTIMVWTDYGEDLQEVPLTLVVQEATLGGAPGRIAYQEDPDGGLFGYLYAFAIVNERPVVFSFMPTPSWGMAGYPVKEYIDAGQRQAILDSFRFLD